MNINRLIGQLVLSISFLFPTAVMACACCTNFGTMYDRTVDQKWRDTLLAGHYVHEQAGWLFDDTGEDDNGPSLYGQVKVTMQPFLADFKLFKENRYLGKLTLKYGKTTEIVRADDLMRVLPKNWREISASDTGTSTSYYKEVNIQGRLEADSQLKKNLPELFFLPQAQLIFHGTGNACPSPEDFHQWGLHFQIKNKTGGQITTSRIRGISRVGQR